MSGKRQATSDLNHDNWDQEEEPEERGVFRTATDDELKNRVIKKAKRKISPDSNAADSGSGSKNVFCGFSGFGKSSTSSETASSSLFSFLNKIPAVAVATSAISTSTVSSATTPQFSFNNSLATGPKIPEASKTTFSFGKSADSVISSEPSKLANGSPEYFNKLSNLNQAVCEWIKTHVDKNPVCILSPIFKDYDKYIEEIENTKKNIDIKEPASEITDKVENPNMTTGIGSKNGNAKIPEADTKSNGFSFDLKKDTSCKPSITPNFSFNLKPPTASTASSTPSVTSSFSFGSLSNNPSQSTSDLKSFSFTTGSAPFSVGNTKPPEVSETTALESEQNEEDEEPPKNEFKQVVEDDAIYSKKCKVFVKKDGNFVDKGVGTLYLKPVESSGKTQLLVRADTNLGNILVNLIISSAIPVQRMGKNNVMMVCLPTPDVEKPTSMLLRVKSGEEADELFENIEKCKK